MARAAIEEDVFQAIASPTRRALLDALGPRERSVSELVDALDVTQSAVSQQLAVLKSAGLVSERAEGRFRYYGICAGPLAEVAAWIDRTRAFHARYLDALGRALDALDDDDVDPKRPKAARPSPRSRRRRPS